MENADAGPSVPRGHRERQAVAVGVASVVCGVVGVAGIGTLLAVDGAGVQHGRTADIAFVLAWLTGGGLALVLGLPARATPLGRLGVGLGIVALPIGLVALGILAAVLT